MFSANSYQREKANPAQALLSLMAAQGKYPE